MIRKSQIYVILSVLILYLLFIQKLYASSSATPDPEISVLPKILINEVSFKNTEHDWIELYVAGSGSIKGLKLFDDNNFLEIDQNINVKPGDYIIVYFKADTETIGYDGDILVIQSKKSGLTGTTEQIAIKNSSNEVVDMVCWRNSSPTATEIEDFNEIKNEQWTEGNIESCINSDNVAVTDSIIRTSLNDTNSANDWQISNSPTPGTNNNVITAGVLEKDEEEETLPQVKLPALIIKTIEADTLTSEESQEIPIKSEAAKEEKNETVCTNNIYINELLPNPDGGDTNREWIELYNSGSSTCNLEGWVIDDGEEGSKPYTLSENDEIYKNFYLILPSWKTKIALNNSNESVRLFNPENTIYDEISYEKSYENQSYSRDKDGEFNWTEEKTPLTDNIFKSEDETEENETEETTKKANNEKKSIVNGSLSDALMITEILPNPGGQDKGNEWIELYNNSEDTLYLGNWSLDTGESSKSKYTFNNNALEPHSHLLLKDSEFGFSLKNSNGEVRLVDFNGEVIDEVIYEKSIENNSFAKISIIEDETPEYEWQWTKNLTPDRENEVKYRVKGEISNYDNLKSVLSLKIENSEDVLDLNVINDGASDLNNMFIKGTKITAVTKKTDEGLDILDDFELTQQPVDENLNTDNNLTWPLIIIISVTGLTAAIVVALKKLKIFKLVKKENI